MLVKWMQDEWSESDQYHGAFTEKNICTLMLLLSATANGITCSCSPVFAKMHGGKLGSIMVDYLQVNLKVPGLWVITVLVRSRKFHEAFRALAKEMHCPVIALSQLNRSLENRPNERPSDVRLA